MISSHIKTLRTIGLVGLVAMVAACGQVPDPIADAQGVGEEKDDDDDPADGKTVVDGSTVVLSGSLALNGAALTGFSLAPTLDSIVMYCVTFEENPRVAKSDFDATGKFSLEVPKGVNFGCFVNDKVTGKTLASVVVEAAEGSFGSGQSSMALSGSLDLGALVISKDGTIKIPQSVLATAAATMESSINVDDMHNSEYAMSCQDVGSAESMAKCKEDVMDGKDAASVFLRILKGKRGDAAVLALGVWKDKAAFDACGGFDITQAEVDKIGTEAGIVLSQASVGSFTDSASCPKRGDGDAELDSNGIETYYALSELTSNGAGYSFRDEEESHSGSDPQGGDPQGGDPQGGNQTNGQPQGSQPQDGQPQGGDQQNGQPGPYLECVRHHVTGIEFSGTAAMLFGAFSSSDTASGQPGCSAESSFNSFNVKFTKK